MAEKHEDNKQNQSIISKTEDVASKIFQSNEIYQNKYIDGEFPRRDSPYVMHESRPLQPKDHTLKPIDIEKNGNNLNNTNYFIQSPSSHFIRDTYQHLDNRGPNEAFANSNQDTTHKNGYLGIKNEFKEVPVFSGATTNINPYNDPIKQEIHNNGGLSHFIEESKLSNELEGSNYSKPPISPLYPFTRLNDKNHPSIANEILFNSYNRNKIPIADIEWRKGFRHIFITRPELYVMANDNGSVVLCDQTEWDDDFASAYIRMPHIIRTLAPWYVSGSFPKDIEGSNWNFLLSNNVQGLNVSSTNMSINENVSKSIEGYTVSTAMHVESRQGSSLELSFMDTKYLEVYETVRLWMLYMHKRKKGIFLPPYNGYQKSNSFIPIGSSSKKLSGTNYTRFHPYDRAIEYGASIYDIVTNESGTRILYWCKYYGVYPISATPSINNENNGPITNMTCSVTFKYHYRLENNNRSLIEFNHDAGLLDDIGKPKTGKVTNSLPFLILNENRDPVMKAGYIGGAGSFVGSPYIVMSKRDTDPLVKTKSIYTPVLQFMKSNNDALFNVGISNNHSIDISNILMSD